MRRSSRRWVEEVDREGLAGVPAGSAIDRDGDGLLRLAGGEGQRARCDGRVVDARPARAVGRDVATVTGWLDGADRLTVNVAVVAALGLALTVVLPIRERRQRGWR